MRFIPFVVLAPLVACGDGPVFPDRPLEVAEVRPAAGAVAVPLDATVSVRFTRAIDPATVDAASLRLDRVRRDGTRTAIRASIEIAPGGRSVTVIPVHGLAHNAAYELAVDPSIVPIGGNPGAFGGARVPFSTVRIVARRDDAVGDTFGTTRPANGPPAPDIASVIAAQRADVIAITVELVEPVGEDEALVGVVEMDVDQDPATGFVPPVVDRLRPADGAATGLGVEYGIELDAEGVATVFHLVGEGRTGSVRAEIEGRFLTLEIPYELLGDDDGNLDLALAIGTAVEATDVFPDDGSLRLGRGGELAARGVAAP